MSAIYFLLLSSLVFALTTRGQECPAPIGGDNMHLKGNSILLQSFPDGTKVSFECEVGYESAGGSAAITCTAGTWSPVRLKCTRRSCGSPGEVENGQIAYPEGVEFGDKISVHCNTGYRLVGKSELFCGALGWLGRLPVCEIMTCDPPPRVVNASLNPVKDVYEYGEVIQYTCFKGLTLNGTKSISCSEEEEFKPKPPNCVNVLCNEPFINDTEWVSGSRPPYGYMATVTYQCKSGSRIMLTCDMNSKWKPEDPKCEAVPPTRPPTSPPKTTTTTQPAVTKKVPTVPVVPTVKPGDGVSKVLQSWLIALGVIIGCCVLIACGCHYFGVPAIIKKRVRSRGDYSGNVATKDEEGEL